MKLPHPTQHYSEFDIEIDVVGGFDNASYCASRRLEDGRIVLGDGRSPSEAISLCKFKTIGVLKDPLSH